MCLLFLLPCFAGAQEPAYTLTGQEELQGTDVYSLLQDTLGNILLTTDRGLLRYDGYGFHTFANSNQKNASLFGLCQAGDGQIWCFNLSGQIFQFNKDSLHIWFGLPDSLLSSSMVLQPDPTGNLIVSCRRLIRINAQKEIEFIDPDRTHIYGTPFLVSAKGAVMHASRDQPYVFISTRTHTDTMGFADPNHFRSRVKTNNLAGTFDHPRLNRQNDLEVYTLREGQWTNLPLQLPGPFGTNFTHKMFLPDPNQIWMALVTGGVIPFDTSGACTSPGGIYFRDHVISAMLKDREGNLWLGTLGSGLLLIPNSGVRQISLEFPSPREKVRNLAGSAEESLYLGTSEGNIWALGPDRRLRLLHHDPEGAIRFLNYYPHPPTLSYATGLHQYTVHLPGGEVSVVPIPNSAKNHYPYPDGLAVHPTSAGIYFTTSTSFPARLRQLQGFLELDDGLATIQGVGRCNAAWWDAAKAELYIGAGTGLLLVSASGQQEITWQSHPIIAGSILSGADCLWINSPQHGLLQVKDGVVTRKFYLPGDQAAHEIRSMTLHGDHLYLGHRNRIRILDLRTDSIRTLDRRNGLTGELIYDFLVHDQEIWVAYPHQIRIIPLGPNPTNPVPPLLRMEEVRVNGDARPLAGAYDLSYQENQLEFRFVAAAFRHQGKLQYAYRLLGAGETWQMLPFQNNTVRFSSLQPGDYTFQVRALNEDGTSSRTLSIPVRLAGPLWSRWWFILLSILLLAALIALGFLYRIRTIQKQNAIQRARQQAEKDLIDSRLTALRSQMNPHFIFNALNSIQEFIMLNEKKLAARYLGKFADLMRIYLNHSQKKTVLLSEEIDALRIYLDLEKLRFEDSLEYSLTFDPGLNPESLSIPSFLIQPYVENALKHGLLHKTTDRRLWVRFRLPEGADPAHLTVLHCEVEDNGVGRQKAAEISQSRPALHDPYATRSTRSRLELLNQGQDQQAGILITDLLDGEGQARGTLVVLRVPAQSTLGR
ncbi:MAG: histidine kinase [Bacteroidia bacterium]|nr:histidine kinase [Bacteroidia bacterium]